MAPICGGSDTRYIVSKDGLEVCGGEFDPNWIGRYAAIDPFRNVRKADVDVASGRILVQVVSVFRVKFQGTNKLKSAYLSVLHQVMLSV